jgi:acetolactate synthase I/III small subunit
VYLSVWCSAYNSVNVCTKVPVWAVLDYTDTRLILRELLLVKVSILGPEYLEEQLVGGPSHSPRRERWYDASHHTQSTTKGSEHQSKVDSEIALAQSFEHSGQPMHRTPVSDPPAITPSEALRHKHQHLQSISTLASQFGAKIVDVSEHSVIVEMTGKSSRVEAFLSLVKPFGVLESARTGGISSFKVCYMLY